MTAEFIRTLLVNSAVFSALFGAMLLVRKLFAKKMSAMLRYALWAAVMVKLLLPFGFESSLSPLGWFPAAPARAEARYVPPAEPEPPAADSAPYAPAGDAAGSNAVPPHNASTGPTQPAAPHAREQAANLGWTDWAMIAWAAGAAATGAWLLVCMALARRRMARNGAAAPRRMMGMLEECGRELGIRRRVSLRLNKAVAVPAVAGVFRPVLMLPAGAVKYDGASLRHILLHELAHLKNGHLPVIQLMNLLTAVYWFNPLAWLCFGLVRRDMETVCDQQVLRLVGREQRDGYVQTVLGFSAAPNARKLHAALAMSSGRKHMERRIRDMFRRRRSGAGARAAAALIAAVMLAASALTACQHTPEKNIVQSKDNDSVQNAIRNDPQSTGEGFSYAAPASWKSTVQDDDKDMSIYVDASVDVPSEHWGIYELIPREITRGEADAAIRALIGDGELRSASPNPSVAELQEQIIQIQAEMAKAKSAGNTELYDIYAKEKLPHLQAELAEAGGSGSGDIKKITPDLLFEDYSGLSEREQQAYGLSYGTGTVRANWQADLGKAAPARIQIALTDGTMKASFVNNGTNDDFPQRGAFSGDGALRGLTISFKDAQAAARQAMEKLGYGYLDIAAVNTNEVYDPERLKNNEYPQCYEFTFNRNLDGVPVAFSYWNGGLWTEDEWEEYNQYAVSWTMREAVVQVDDSGVIGVKINVPKSDVKRLAYGVELMDFEEIMGVFEKQVLIEGCFSPLKDQFDVKNKSVYVRSIKLNYMPTAWKDHPGEMIFVPVWDFYGSQTTLYNAKPSDVDSKGLDRYQQWVDGQLQRSVDLGEQSILTINALDGTIMRRNAYMD